MKKNKQMKLRIKMKSQDWPGRKYKNKQWLVKHFLCNKTNTVFDLINVHFITNARPTIFKSSINSLFLTDLVVYNCVIWLFVRTFRRIYHISTFEFSKHTVNLLGRIRYIKYSCRLPFWNSKLFGAERTKANN